jgi:outer membrane protein TolC
MRSITLIAVVVMVPLASAQQVDSLVQEGLRNNPQLRSYTYQRQAAEYRASAVGALPAPALGVEFSQIPASSARVLDDAIANNLSLSQMFMLGGKLSAMSEVERRRGGVIDQGKASFEVQLRGRIKMGYYRLWLLDRQIGVQKGTLRILEELVQSMRPHVLTNRMRQADFLSIQAEVASGRARLEEMISRRTGSESALNSMIGRNDLQTPIGTDSLLRASALSSSESQLASRVAAENPALLSMDRMKEMNESMITAAGRELIPDLMVQGMIMRMPNGMVLTGGQRSAEAIQQSAAGMPMQKPEWMYSVMFSVTLPFMPWSVERSTAKQEELRSSILSIEADREAMRREMTASLRSAMVKYTANDSLAKRYTAEILPLVRESAAAQTVAYQTGQVPVTTVLDARRMELMKQEEYFMVLMERQMALTEMEMMVGTPLNVERSK